MKIDGRGRHGNHAKGPRNGRWNGGKYNCNGYTMVTVPQGHHLAHKVGFAPEHRIVAERKIGRRLQENEVVHHLNGDKSDNRPENIEVMTQAEHARIHAEKTRTRDRLGRFTAAMVTP